MLEEWEECPEEDISGAWRLVEALMRGIGYTDPQEAALKVIRRELRFVRCCWA
ncbi:hypothetical protein [Deinococcus hopiensis]|uniref:Uncharacterized protein n=1 Tax=Deinococcus hopiensis KR-140 TaxID=695939 RepID=A0A1W1VDY2_9DEIO|nr:hypothetical protein [Deinococcus hopiensis]SMB91154.1 hypothetical protein SAMN00790413_01011 [Deinococcus hopiensis KR-140]